MKLFRKEKLAALLFLSVSALLSASDSPRAEAEPATDEPARPLFRVCVMDFVQADIVGQRRFLDQESRPIAIPPQCTLNQADRMSIHSVMQGFVRMIDARDAARTNEANRWRMADDNRWERTKALDLFRTVVKGQSRPIILGAEQLSALLSRHGDVFACTDPSLMAAAMDRLCYEPDFPVDFQRKLADMTGATHLLTGTVADLRVSSKKFQGYGIETATTRYELDFSYKLVDLRAQSTVYGGMTTGVYTERKLPGIIEKEPSLFQNLLNDALRQADEDLYRACKPGKDCKVRPPALPEKCEKAEEKAGEPAQTAERNDTAAAQPAAAEVVSSKEEPVQTKEPDASGRENADGAKAGPEK